MSARRVGLVLIVGMLAVSGAYLLIYLYRWEWNRALVAGIFFLAAEVALAATALLRRMGALEQRLDRLVAPARGTTDPGQAARLVRIQEATPERPNRFEWLDPTRTNVFVPVLLGAGVLLSGLAAVVERLAGATATPVLEHRLATRLAPMALPAAGLLVDPVNGPSPEQLRSAAEQGRRRRTARRLAVVAVLALVAFWGVDVLADATQTRPDTIAHDQASEITVAISFRGRARPTVNTAEGLWAACRTSANWSSEAARPVDLGGGRVHLVVSPALGDHAQQRFTGCVQDLTLDRTQARVESIARVPAER